MIHQWIGRDDMASLLAEVAKVNRSAAERGSAALQQGDVDTVLDLPVTLDVVRGMGGAPAPLPLSILWYVPVRAAMRKRGESNIRLADFTATIPVLFHSMAIVRSMQRGEQGLAAWHRSIATLPSHTVVRAERSAQLAAVALWWAGCFPETVERRGGSGMLRAYVDFASTAFAESARILRRSAPEAADVYRQASGRVALVRQAMADVKSEYLDADAHTRSARLGRFLSRLQPTD